MSFVKMLIKITSLVRLIIIRTTATTVIQRKWSSKTWWSKSWNSSSKTGKENSWKTICSLPWTPNMIESENRSIKSLCISINSKDQWLRKISSPRKTVRKMRQLNMETFPTVQLRSRRHHANFTMRLQPLNAAGETNIKLESAKSNLTYSRTFV